MPMQPRPWPKVPELTVQVAWTVAARGPARLMIQGEDGSGDDRHAVGAATGSAEDVPGLQSRDASFDRCSWRWQGPVDRPLGRSEVLVLEDV